MAGTPGTIGAWHVVMVFDSEDEAKRHEAASRYGSESNRRDRAILAKGVVTAKKGSADDLMRRPQPHKI